MTQSPTPEKRFHAGLGVGLAFLVGIVVFVIAFQIINRLRPATDDERLIPAAARTAGKLSMPIWQEKPPTEGANSTQPGPQWSLENQRGKIAIVNVFATWCGPCREEMPALQALANEYAARGVVMAAISIDKDGEREPGTTRETALHDFANDLRPSFPILLPQPESALLHNEFAIPQTLLYDRQGRQARLIVGAIDKESLKRSLEELLKEK